jgi:hypothetical protein
VKGKGKVKNEISLEDVLSQYSLKDKNLAIEEAEAISRKAVLCGIIEQVSKDRFDITSGFRASLNIVGKLLEETPDITETYCSGLSYETDRQGVMLVIGLYLAYRRIRDRRQTGNKNFFKIHDILDEAASISYDEMNDLTRLMYGLLQYKYERDRITPLILEMSKETIHGVYISGK